MSDSMKNLNTFKRNNKLTQPANPEVSHATYFSKKFCKILLLSLVSKTPFLSFCKNICFNVVVASLFIIC